MTDQSENPHIELLTFQVGDQEYALEIEFVREIRGWTEITPLPHAPNHVKGVINLRGTVLPIMGLAQRLGIPTQDDACERNVIIVVKHDDAFIGLLVDAVLDIIMVMSQDFQCLPEGAGVIKTDLIRELILQDDRMIRLLDLKATIMHEKINAA